MHEAAPAGAAWSVAEVDAFLVASTGGAPAASAVPAHVAEGHAAAGHEAMGHGGIARLEGSGTAWLPAAAPMEAVHPSAGAWTVMIHGAAFPRYTTQDAFGAGSRGDAAFGAPNWAMGMARRRVGSGELGLHAMLSLDPLTEGGNGYPLLFQSGETFESERLVDRQHPHDLFSELAVSYTHPLTDRTAVFGYLGYPGEPAVGPIAFLHRPSARYNADSPLSHHWHDATHVVFGVATLGVATGPVKVDASVFTGREPGEERLGFDRPRFDSYSARATWAASDRLVFHAARAFLREPESLEPGVDQWRTTASALYSAPVGAGGDVSLAIVWGANDLRPGDGVEHHAGVQHAVLGEATLRLGPNALYGRAEFAQKSAEELDLDDEELHDLVFGIGSLTLGAARHVAAFGPVTAALGAQGTIFAVPEDLQPLYGTSPVGLQVYLRFALDD